MRLLGLVSRYVSVLYLGASFRMVAYLSAPIHATVSVMRNRIISNSCPANVEML